MATCWWGLPPLLSTSKLIMSRDKRPIVRPDIKPEDKRYCNTSLESREKRTCKHDEGQVGEKVGPEHAVCGLQQLLQMILFPATCHRVVIHYRTVHRLLSRHDCDRIYSWISLVPSPVLKRNGAGNQTNTDRRD